MEVVVEYPYEAQEPDELTLKEGDIVTNVIQKLDGWWEGSLGGKKGLFPDNFVKVIKNNVQSGKGDEVCTDQPVQLRVKPTTRRLKALFSYSPEQDDELALDVGDVLEFISEVEDGWYKGSHKGKTGIFPSNFVTDVEAPTTNGTPQAQDKSNPQPADNRVTYIKASPDVIPSVDRTLPPCPSDDEPAPKLPPKPIRDVARCFFSYVAQNEDELSINEGDIITVISKSCEDDGWWRGELRGRIGVFPDNFVKLISPTEALTANSTTSSSVPHQKILAQGRNIAGIVGGDASIKKEAPKPVTDTSEPDGSAGSKSKIDKNFPSNKKVKPVKDLKDLPIGIPSTTTKPMTPPSPVSPRGVSYLSNINLKPTAKREPSVKKEQSEEDTVAGEEFNAVDFDKVERNEKLSHLTANRAKAPKRRPPSQILSRENEPGVVNGTSLDNSFDSSHQTSHNGPSYNNSSSFSSGNFTTSSTVVVSDGSNTSTPGSRPLQNRESDTSKDENSTPSGNAGVAKPKKLLPWITELRQTQDKKRALVTTPNLPTSTASNNNSPIQNVSLNSSTTSNTSSSSPTPAFTSTPLGRSKDKEKDPIPNSTNLQTTPTTGTKAPPLPAKPVIQLEKVPASANINNSNPINTTPTNTTSTVSSVSMKFGGRKTPTSTTTSTTANNYVNSVTTPSATSINPPPPSLLNNHGPASSFTSTNALSDAVQNASSHRTGSGSTPEFVPYEEFARLKERVAFLECELEAVKKKLYDRDLNKAHVV